MHRPEAWGYVQFSDLKVDAERSDTFVPKPEEKIKWALRDLFYQQQQFKSKYGRYSADPTQFTLPEVDIKGYTFSPAFYVGEATFEIATPALDGSQWHINEMARIWKE